MFIVDLIRKSCQLFQIFLRSRFYEGKSKRDILTEIAFVRKIYSVKLKKYILNKIFDLTGV